MTYRELLELLAKRNQGTERRERYWESDRGSPAFPQHPSSVYPEQSKRPALIWENSKPPLSYEEFRGGRGWPAVMKKTPDGRQVTYSAWAYENYLDEYNSHKGNRLPPWQMPNIQDYKGPTQPSRPDFPEYPSKIYRDHPMTRDRSTKPKLADTRYDPFLDKRKITKKRYGGASERKGSPLTFKSLRRRQFEMGEALRRRSADVSRKIQRPYNKTSRYYR